MHAYQLIHYKNNALQLPLCAFISKYYCVCSHVNHTFGVVFIFYARVITLVVFISTKIVKFNSIACTVSRILLNVFLCKICASQINIQHQNDIDELNSEIESLNRLKEHNRLLQKLAAGSKESKLSVVDVTNTVCMYV